jgi:2-polyprenyl-3-methyl-5-hydroxy-6-metoxy-1,4-benzoquinol methylase
MSQTTLPAAPDARFWDRVAAKYAKKPVPDEEAYRLTLERVRAYLTSGDHVLEVGCGTGSTALELAAHAGDIVATDISAEMISIARQKAEARGIQNVRFASGNLDAAWLAPGSFDVVMAFNLIHLLVDVPASIRRSYELIKPGGLFISKTPCIGDASFLIRGMLPILRVLGKAPFVNDVKQESLKTGIAEAGFDISETGNYPAKSYSLFVVGRKAIGLRSPSNDMEAT